MLKVLLVVLAVVAVSQAAPAPNWWEAAPDIGLYFTWKDCGTNPARPLKIHSLSVTPDPVKLPGTVTISYDVESTAQISNMDLDLNLRKKLIIGSITVPCVNNIGSCTYEDICQHVPEGSCPLKAGRFTRTVQVPLPEVDSSLGGLISGKYIAKAEFSETGTGMELGCFEATIRLKIE